MCIAVAVRLIAAIEFAGTAIVVVAAIEGFAVRIVRSANRRPEVRLARITIARIAIIGPATALIVSTLIRSALIESTLVESALRTIGAIEAAVPPVPVTPTVGARPTVGQAPIGHRVAVRVVARVIKEHTVRQPVQAPAKPPKRESPKSSQCETEPVLNGRGSEEVAQRADE